MEGPLEPIVATGCVSIRELSRSTSELIDRVERDEAAFVISRRGRMVALVTPLPERLALEFDTAVRAVSPDGEVPDATDVDLAALQLTELEQEFIVDASLTPTGFWRAPTAVFVADERAYFDTLAELEFKGLTIRSAGVNRLTKVGRSVARELIRRGRKGYAEAHGDDYLDP
jgi:prevent-host-death family protein